MTFLVWTKARYRFVRDLTERGFTRISLALDLETGEHVVVKYTDRDGSPEEMTRLAQLRLHEAELLRSLPDGRVSSTPRLIDCFEENGRTFLVQEYLEGSVLHSWQQQRPTIATFFDVYASLAHALERLHEAGVIYRDLKPRNVLLVEGQPYLLDFGLSAHAGDDGATGIVGTPIYMSPEMVQGSMPLEGSADVFALGLMLYEGMTGVLPFDRASDLSSLLTARAALDLSSHVRFPELGLPAHVVHVFQMMLSITPSSRPSASEAATALRAAAALARLTLQSTTIPLPVP